MDRKLVRFTVLTCLTLLGIISLQAFWLVNSYQEKRDHLRSDLENAMMELMVFTSSSNNMLHEQPQLSAAHNDASLFPSFARDTVIKGTDTILFFQLDAGTDSLVNKDKINEMLIQIANELIQPHDRSFEEFNQKLKEKFKSSSIDIPYEMAFFDMSGNMVKCSTDTSQFAQIKFKTSLTSSLPVNMEKQIGRIQLAFPDVSEIVLRKMIFILSLSIFLIVLCGWSLSRMIVFFIKQKRISEIRNDLTNNMTHELKTPISSVTVALGLLRDESAAMTQEQKDEYLQIADNELNRLSLLVDKVLKMAAFEKGEIKIHPQVIPVKPWLDDIVTTLKPALSSIPSRVTLTIYPDLLKIRGDRTHLTNVIQNLVDNAIKYRDKKKEQLIIHINAWANDTDYFLEVQDNGIGIPFMHVSRVFDKFFRVPTGDEHETKGYGLGLSYVKEITNLHCGHIEVESQLGIGTRFKLTIPKK